MCSGVDSATGPADMYGPTRPAPRAAQTRRRLNRGLRLSRTTATPFAVTRQPVSSIHASPPHGKPIGFPCVWAALRHDSFGTLNAHHNLVGEASLIRRHTEDASGAVTMLSLKCRGSRLRGAATEILLLLLLILLAGALPPEAHHGPSVPPPPP